MCTFQVLFAPQFSDFTVPTEISRIGAWTGVFIKKICRPFQMPPLKFAIEDYEIGGELFAF